MDNQENIQNNQNKSSYKWDLERLRELAQKVYEDEQERLREEIIQKQCPPIQ